jgi:hypothetical protein
MPIIVSSNIRKVRKEKNLEVFLGGLATWRSLRLSAVRQVQ